MQRYIKPKLLAFLLLVSAVILIFVFTNTPSEEQPEAQNGVLDLSQWNFNSQGYVKLLGEWQLYWQKFIDPGKFPTDTAPLDAVLDYLPRWWNIEDAVYPTYPLEGYATYHLRVHLPPDEVGKLYAIASKDSAYTFYLYVNSNKVLQRGTPVEKSGEYSPLYNNTTGYFTVRDTTVDITIHISMFGDRNGGIARPFFLGRADVINTRTRNLLLIDTFLLGIVCVLTLYHLLIFSLRPSDLSPLYFAGLCFVTGFRNIFQNSKMAFVLFPDISNILYVKCWYSAYYLLIPLFLLFFFSLFPRQMHKKVVVGFTSVSLFFVLITFITPLSFFCHILNIYHIFFLGIATYTVYATLKALKHKEHGADIMLTGLIIIIFFAANDIFHNLGVITTGYYVPYGFILFILSQTYLMSLRYAIAYKNVESLSTELTYTNRKLREMNTMKDEFLANTSHELRTPLNGIIGIAEIVRTDTQYIQNQTLRDNLEIIIASGKRLSSMVNDLLDFSRMKNNEITIIPKRIHMYTQVSIVFEHFRHSCRQKNIKLQNTIDPNSSYIYADENRIQQILFNLVGNAVKFTESGYVRASAEIIEKDNTSYYAVSIEDTGIGIQKEYLDTIFEPFEQADGSITRNYGGTGLGLSISRIIIECHGGFLSVTSTPQTGSVFTFHLPALTLTQSEEKPGVPETHGSEQLPAAGLHELPRVHMPVPSLGSEDIESPPCQALENATIMIVDDDPVNVKILSNQLRKFQTTEIIELYNGSEAVDRIENETAPDIILLDIMMPVISGYEVARTIRKRYQLLDIPIIMLTAKDTIQDIITAFRSGANDYLRKPFNSYELVARINMHLSLKKAIGERQRLIGFEEDMAIAKEIQDSALSHDVPLSDRFTINVKYVPMKEIGGDFYGFHTIDENRTGILIADVNGHGIHAALVASMLKVIFSTLKPYADSPVRLLTELNSIIMQNTEYSYMTALYGILDTEEMTLTYSRAGHEPVLVYRSESDEILTDDISGRIIGYSDNVNFEEGTIDLQPGDRIMFTTDGIEETFNNEYEMYGRERFLHVVRQCADASGDEFVNAVIDDLNKWSGKNEHSHDDITLIAVDLKRSTDLT